MKTPLTLLGSRNHRSNVAAFEIRLKEGVIVLRGSPDEAAGALLEGTVHLVLVRRTTIRAIKLRLEGRKMLRWVDMSCSPTQQRLHKKDELVYEKDWSFLPEEKAFELQAGTHEFPFSVVLPGSTPESIEGLVKAHLKYRLKAVLQRSWPRAEIVAGKALRIVRTLLPSAVELSQTLSIDSIWPDKVEYSIAIPQKAVVFGSNVPVEITLTPLIKGIRPGKTSLTLQEFLHLDIGGKVGKVIEKRDICNTVFEASTMDIVNEGATEKWVMYEKLNLPRSLYSCVQDCESGFIKIRHKVKFAIQIENEDGHLSELRASIPVMLFISPNFLMNEAGQITVTPPENLSELDEQLPRYVDRHYDALWTESTSSQSEFLSDSSVYQAPYPFSANPSSSSLLNPNSSNSSNAFLPTPLSSRPTSTGSQFENLDYFLLQHGPNPHNHSEPLSIPALLSRLSRCPSYQSALRAPSVDGDDIAPAYTPMSTPALTRESSREDQVQGQDGRPEEGIDAIRPERWRNAVAVPKVNGVSNIGMLEVLRE